jgi:hypothetical protein
MSTSDTISDTKSATSPASARMRRKNRSLHPDGFALHLDCVSNGESAHRTKYLFEDGISAYSRIGQTPTLGE